jgi:hypothetical protein
MRFVFGAAKTLNFDASLGTLDTVAVIVHSESETHGSFRPH